MNFSTTPLSSPWERGQRRMSSILPAKDSEIFGTKRGLADPVRAKVPGLRS